jgi:general secretion pathway protein G
VQVAERRGRAHSGLGEGFTLLELMVVITLILILATFAMPMYHTAKVRTQEAILRDHLFTMRSQIDRFTHDNERGPTSLDELVEQEYIGSIPTDPFTGSNETWQVDTETESLSIDGSAPLGIVDVHSGSNDNSLEGTPYSSW